MKGASKWLLTFSVLVYFGLSPSLTHAGRSLQITSNKTSLFGEEEMNVSASASGFTEGETIYVKAAFYKDGTNYFGFTKKDDSWVKNSVTAADQRQIIIGQWDGSATVRSDFSDSGYSGKGEYNLKIGFYYLTSGGNMSSVNWSSNNLTISLDQPVQTSIPTQAPVVRSITSVPTSAKISTAITPTSIVSSKSQNTPAASKNTPNSAKITQEFKISSSYAKLKSTITKKNLPKEAKVLGRSERNYTYIFLPVGFLLILIAGGALAARNMEQIKIWIKNL